MSILQNFCQAFEKAIVEYEAEWNGKKGISIERQNQIKELRAYLAQCQNSLSYQSVTAFAVRQEMLERIGKIPFEWGEFFFGTRLITILEKVLKLPRFGDVQLMNSQYSEIQNIHQAQMSTLTDEVKKLTNQVNELSDKLMQESAKDSVKRVNELTEELGIERDKNVYLISLNEKLSQLLKNTVDMETHEKLSKSLLDVNQQYQTLQKNHDTLSKEHTDLKAKYDALLAKQNLSANQNATLLNYSPNKISL